MTRRPECVLSVLLAVTVGMASQGLAQPLPQVPSNPGALQKRGELMKSRGPEGSLTILPINLAGQPFLRVSEVVALLLERQGLRNIEIESKPFEPPGGVGLDALAASLGGYVKDAPVTTEYVLYAEYNGTRESGLQELRGVVVDRAGDPVWMVRQGSEDEAMRNLESKSPMTLSVLLAEQLSPALGLTEETAKNAKPGKIARLMDERNGLPPEAERAPLPDRQRQLKEAGPAVTLTVCPPRVGGTVDISTTQELVKLISDAGLCLPVPSAQVPSLKASQADPSELKILWDFAREVRAYSRTNTSATEYTLYPDYVFNPDQWQQGFVHFVVCDRTGEWVIVDMQNSHHPDYQGVKPTSTSDCHRLLVQRLRGYLRGMD